MLGKLHNYHTTFLLKIWLESRKSKSQIKTFLERRAKLLPYFNNLKGRAGKTSFRVVYNKKGQKLELKKLY